MQGMLRMARLGIVGVWVGLLVVLARPHLPSGASAPLDGSQVVPAASAADEEWMGLYMADHKIGYSHSRITPAAGGYQLEDTSYMRLTVLNEEQSITAAISATTDADYALQSFTVDLNGGIGRLEVNGAISDGALQLRLTSAGETTQQRIPLSDPIYLPGAARARLRTLGLTPGRAMTLRVFDPSSLDHHPLEMRVAGRESLATAAGTVPAWKVRETFRELTTEVWLDDAGRTLREQGPMGLVAKREDAVQAVSSGWGSEAFDLMAELAVPVHGSIDHPRELTQLTARIAGLGGNGLPADQRQRTNRGVIHVARESDRPATYTLPYTGEDRREDLEATAFLQIDHPRVRAAAAEALGDTHDPREAAERLRRWVYHGLEKRPVASIPNAVQVLEMGAGDCNEHAVLYAALARAVGLPSRVVAGIVYVDGSFLYHAWDEVWLGSSWVSVDPAFDQMPVDATHVKLVTGGPEAHAALIPLIGRLSIQILPADTDSAG